MLLCECPDSFCDTEMQISEMRTKLEHPFPDEFGNEFNDIRTYASHKEVTQDIVDDTSLRRRRYIAKKQVHLLGSWSLKGALAKFDDDSEDGDDTEQKAGAPFRLLEPKRCTR